MTKPCPDDLAAFKHEPADYEHCDLLRPIIGIENRTAREVFDIMADRIRHRTQANEAMREALERIRQISSKPTYPGNNLRDIDDIARNALSGDSA